MRAFPDTPRKKGIEEIFRVRLLGFYNPRMLLLAVIRTAEPASRAPQQVHLDAVTRHLRLGDYFRSHRKRFRRLSAYR